ncbi:tail fiber domain-containing protein [Chitinibacter tainanensis]|uniref:tail fiber domain-containing protein n=1 Tax=Chitinibacter tainanensis TaxID=230667 RepID=UPI0003FB29FF|nr:tail fiber domain-containing protein [Chitinibacter tainanensis]
MQSYTEITDNTALAASLKLLLDNDKTAISLNSGTAFPTANLQLGMPCYRTDLKALYILEVLSPVTWTKIADFNLNEVAVLDSRTQATTPDTYNDAQVQFHLKNSSVAGLGSSGLAKIMGIRGWGDATGGRAFELGFANDGTLALRSGNDAAGGWGSWATMWTTANFNPSNYQPALGFTPVQQGGGAGQNANKIYLGWSGSALKAQVDSSDLGTFWLSSNFDPNTKLGKSGDTLSEVYNNGWYRSNGNVGWYSQSYGGGIWMTDSTYVRVYGGKQFYCDSSIVAAGNVVAYSDARLKTNVAKISDPWKIIDQIEGVTFNWRKGIHRTRLKAGKRDYGVIAQKVKRVMPEAIVRTKPSDTELDRTEYMGVDYTKLVPVLIEAVKSLNERVRTLEARGQ